MQDWDYWIIWAFHFKFFEENPYYFSFSIVTAAIYLLSNSVVGSLSSAPSPAFVTCRLSNDGHSECEVLPHCSFALHVSNYL